MVGNILKMTLRFLERKSCRLLEGAGDSLRRRPAGKREKKNGVLQRS